MKTILASIGFLGIAFAAAPAGAMTIPRAQHAGEVIKAHGVHWSCRKDRYGWHRSPDGDRRPCGHHLGTPGVYLDLGPRHRRHHGHDDHHGGDHGHDKPMVKPKKH